MQRIWVEQATSLLRWATCPSREALEHSLTVNIANALPSGLLARWNGQVARSTQSFYCIETVVNAVQSLVLNLACAVRGSHLAKSAPTKRLQAGFCGKAAAV